MIKVIDNFLSKEECNILIESNQNGLDIPKYDLAYQRSCVSKFIKLSKLESDITKIVEETHKGLEVDKEFEFIKYLPGDKFHWHNDIQIGNPKVYFISCIILLNEDFEGGKLIYDSTILKNSSALINTAITFEMPSNKQEPKIN